MRSLEENRSGGALCGVAKAMSSVEQQGNGTATICGALQRLSAAKMSAESVDEQWRSVVKRRDVSQRQS